MRHKVVVGHIAGMAQFQNIITKISANRFSVFGGLLKFTQSGGFPFGSSKDLVLLQLLWWFIRCPAHRTQPPTTNTPPFITLAMNLFTH